MTALIPVVILILGAFAYGFAANGKVAELGRLAFGCALLALMFFVAGHAVKLF